MSPHDPLSSHFRLVAAQTSALRKLGLTTIHDLLYHFPVRYEQAGAEGSTRTLVPGSKVTLYGVLSKLESKRLWKSKRPATEGWFEDGQGRVKVMWFNQPYIAKMAPQGTPVKVTGTVGGSAERPYLTNPEVTPASALPEGLFAADSSQHTAHSSQLFPIYPESQGITSRWFFHAFERIAQSGVLAEMPEPIPEDICQRYHLPALTDALVWIHRPEKESHATSARKRFAFEEIFAIQAARARERALNDAQASFPIFDANDRVASFLATIPFRPTDAQQRSIGEIIADFSRPHPMARLLEGDVGAGKTLVAAAAACAVVTSRPKGRESGTLQVAYMAPTEILARQHFESFCALFKHLPLSIGLITGSGAYKFPSKSRAGTATSISKPQLQKWVANGEIAVLIGTHALIQKKVAFKHLALCIVDEQHRFGTAQRRALAHKGDAAPHFLSMTATPIPRTLALTLWGDLDLSVLDELPPGRARITTRVVGSAARSAAYAAIEGELAKGHQAYVICPRIDEPDPTQWNAMQAKSAVAEAKRLKKDVFPNRRIGLLHGGMTPKEKDTVMMDFTKGGIDILVATSVVEVGVNVPNATAIMIEGAERFGLAQLHQLRGRVQRSSYPPLCFLVSDTAGATALKRLKTLEKNADGFTLAEADLQNRGAGDLLGRKQWGISDIGMEALQNPRLIAAAREEAQKLIAHDPSLASFPALRKCTDAIAKKLHRE